MTKRILIAGASAAGPALAWWLHRFGLEVTVVERAPEFRDGGQNIDVRGAARTVLARMGLFEAVKAQGTGEQGLFFRCKAASPCIWARIIRAALSASRCRNTPTSIPACTACTTR